MSRPRTKTRTRTVHEDERRTDVVDEHPDGSVSHRTLWKEGTPERADELRQDRLLELRDELPRETPEQEALALLVDEYARRLGA